jgi:hypothetical protein
MSDDFDAFKSDDDGPPDGDHNATLPHAYVFESQRGDTFVKCEWQTTEYAYYFESLHGTKGNGRQFTKAVLGGMGIDLSRIGSWDELNQQLSDAEGNDFLVGVEHKGNFLNVTVAGRAEAVQAELPVDTSDFERTTAPTHAGAAGRVGAARCRCRAAWC